MSESMIRIGARAFVLAAAIILALMVVSGIMTLTVPPGSYERVEADGRLMVVPGSYRTIEQPDYPVWRWFTAPIEVLFAPGNITVITIILFLVLVGGSFTVLEQADVLGAFLRDVAVRMRARRFLLMALLQGFFMLNAAVLGIYEAMVPLIVFIVPLAHMLGWDSLTGLGMSLLPLAFGFAAGISNPFTIGVVQTIAELPLFSGAWLRIPLFLVVFCIIHLYVRRHALAIERDPERSPVYRADLRLRRVVSGYEVSNALPVGLRRALAWFGGAMAIAIVFIIATARIPALSMYAFPLMALLFVVGGAGAGLFAGLGGGGVVRAFAVGARNMLPGVLLIMMSMSVKHIVDSGGITDTVLHGAADAISRHTPLAAAFLIYGATLMMNFFIGSASAKAFLMMPILTPLADLVGITRQTAVLAFGYGDGFSNVLYPTNALLLIGLSFTTVGYPAWLRWTLPLQIVMLAVTSLFLVLAVQSGYGPF